MSTAIGIITAFLLAASAYFAYQNKAHYVKQVEDRQATEKKKTELVGKLKVTEERRDQTKSEKVTEEANLAAKETEVSKAKALVAKLEAEAAEKKDMVDKQQAEIDAVKAQLEKQGEVKALVADLQQLKQDLTTLEAQIGSSNAKLSSLVAEQKRTENAIEHYREINDLYANNRSAPTLSANISGIYENFGFVTINAGNADGVVTGSTLEVFRDGAVVAKLLVKSVEAHTSAADIVPDSLAKDTVLMSGDDVRSPAAALKKEDAPAPAPSAASPAPAPAASTTVDPLAAPAADAAATPAPPAEKNSEDPFAN